MTKADILNYFSDIDEAYNDCSRYESFERCLDELIHDTKKEAFKEGMKLAFDTYHIYSGCLRCPKLRKDFIEDILAGVEITIPYRKYMGELENENDN